MTRTSFSNRGLSAAVVVSIFFGLLPAAQPAPGLGGLSGGAARALGAGGVIIDYRAARSWSASDELDVERTDDGLVVHVGAVEHRLALAPWEVAELLRVVHVVEDDGYLEVSIDPLSDGSQGLGTTPELVVDREITPLGMALLQADVDFAAFCRGVANPSEPSLYRASPTIRAIELLEHDEGYRRLTLDFVTPPVLRSQIRASVDSLAHPEPVAWTTGVEVHYATPQGPLTDEVDDEVVAQAERPYRRLAHRVDEPGPRGRAVRAKVPALARVEAYAIALTALDAHCRKDRGTCDRWHADALAAAEQAPARVPAVDEREMDAYLSGIMLSSQLSTWANTRYEVVKAAPPPLRTLALLDELVFDARTGWGDQQLINDLLAEPAVVDDAVTRLLLDFHRGLVLRDDSPPLTPAELFRMMRRVDEVAGDPRRALAVREILAASVLSTPWLHGSEAWAAAEHTMTRCIHELDEAAELARTAPQQHTAEHWLGELGRLERCRPTVRAADWALLRIGASFHYAAGASWAVGTRDGGAPQRRMAHDRLRVLRAHERALLTRGDEEGWAQLRAMIDSLGGTVRG